MQRLHLHCLACLYPQLVARNVATEPPDKVRGGATWLCRFAWMGWLIQGLISSRIVVSLMLLAALPFHRRDLEEHCRLHRVSTLR